MKISIQNQKGINLSKVSIDSVKYRKWHYGCSIIWCPLGGQIIYFSGKEEKRLIIRSNSLCFIPHDIAVLVESSMRVISEIKITDTELLDYLQENPKNWSQTEKNIIVSSLTADNARSLFTLSTAPGNKKYIVSFALSLFGVDALFYLKKSMSTTCKVMSVIEKHVSKNLMIRDVCKMLHTSQSTLKRKLYLENTNFSALNLNVRMHEAKKLLYIYDYNIDVIASMCGYDNPSYFSKVFREYWGELPSVYQRKINNN